MEYVQQFCSISPFDVVQVLAIRVRGLHSTTTSSREQVCSAGIAHKVYIPVYVRTLISYLLFLRMFVILYQHRNMDCRH